ncbi:MAG: zinc ribbon domain-containing protein [Clostridiales bacterium]|jgi:RNA polymerase subunit RPABC4/transcription elongation factor Spt4|nr:zinc ribbon domain-containing protein [Clostridiales bacterium]MDR2749717.1 zinc ribbon domain-containing protein [Clostridiales bacterium]
MSFSDTSKTFSKNPAVSLEDLARGIEQYLIQREDMVSQIFQTATGYSIQTKKKDEWKKYVMLDKAMQIDLAETEKLLTVHIGGAKWISKGAALGIGLTIASWPLALPLVALSSIGGIGNLTLPISIMDFIGQFLDSDGTNIAIPPEGLYSSSIDPQRPLGGLACPACGASIPADADFCPNCGVSTAPKKTICPACGKELAGNPKFCLHCGEKLH